MIKFFGKQNIVYLILGMVLLVHVLILTKLIYFPYPELFIYPYLTNHGLKPYSQILDQHFPGLMFLPINLDNLGMHTPEVARIWSISIVLIIHIMLFLVSSKILKSKTKALLVNILYLIWQPFFEGWVLWIDNFLPLLLLPAFYTLYKRWFFIAGLLIGLAIVFKQTIVPLSIIVLIYLFWTTRNLKTVPMFLLGTIIPIALMSIYLMSIGVLKDFWYWTIIFNLTTYAEFGRGTGPTFAHFLRVAFVFGLAFLLLILSKIKIRETQLLLIFLVGALFGLSTRFDFVHFQPALPFALIATVYGLRRLEGVGRLGIINFRGLKVRGFLNKFISKACEPTLLRAAENPTLNLPPMPRKTVIAKAFILPRHGGGGFLLAIIIVYGLVLVWWLIIFYKGHLGNRVISFDPNTYDLADKITRYTNPGEKIFVYGAAPHLYQMSGTLPAGDVFVFQFPWFLKVSQGRILEGIKRDKPNIVVSDRTVEIEGLKITDFAHDIDQYIQQNYQRIDKVGITDILRLNKL